MRDNNIMKALSLVAAISIGVAGCQVGKAPRLQTTEVDYGRLPQAGAGERTLQPDSRSRKIFVANRSSNAITVFSNADNGDAQPLFSIRGANTKLSAPSSAAFDLNGLLYVLNEASTPSIVVFAARARGNVTPMFDISGGATQLSNPQALAVDATGTTYVTNSTGGSSYISVFAPGSNGNRAPVRTIFDGSNFIVPAGVALHGNLLYVADQFDQSINEYIASSNGIVNPVSVIMGLSTPIGVAVDSRGLIYVTDHDSILVFAADANGFTTPLRIISGSQTLMDGAVGLTVAHSEIVVANSASNSITVYPQDGNGNISPLRQIAGVLTKLSSPQSAPLH